MAKTAVEELVDNLKSQNMLIVDAHEDHEYINFLIRTAKQKEREQSIAFAKYAKIYHSRRMVEKAYDKFRELQNEQK